MIRRLRAGDIWPVLRVEWLAFPEDPWTTATAGGRLDALVAGRPRRARSLARAIRRTRLTAVVSAGRLLCLVALGRPRGLLYLVAEAGPTVAGYGCLKTTGTRGDIQSLAVLAPRRSQGLGGGLLAALVDAARRRGCRHVSLFVRADNAGARRLYERRGFVVDGVRPGYYRPSGTDAVVMRLELA